MKIKNLTLKNVGPFREAYLEFPQEHDASGKLPVTIVTGENGTGKSVIIDAIRLLLNSDAEIGRDIIRNHDDFKIKMMLNDEEEKKLYTESKKGEKIHRYVSYTPFFSKDESSREYPNWVADYWNSDMGKDSFIIYNLSSIDLHDALVGAMDGISSNVELTNFICTMDYLRSSDNKIESETGKYVYELIKRIFNECLIDGNFVNVRRQTLGPMVLVKGTEVSLDKLSSGNLLLIERLIGLLQRMYSICMLNKRPISEITQIDGILLIDEIENHLHPLWQRRIVTSLQKMFPNLQIIMTTHSPFVVSSVDNARIYVCESKVEYAIVRDMTDDYSNLPVDEVLASDVFGVSPFAIKISNIMEQRIDAIKAGDTTKAKELGDKLVAMNRNAFGFINLKETLNATQNEAH